MTLTDKDKKSVTVGILEGFKKNSTKNYIKACQELDIPYEIIDFVSPDWIKNIKQSKADIFVTQPEVWVSVEKQMYDERLYFMVNYMGKIIYPSYDELFIYENKRNMAYWLEINNIPHPKTKVIYLRYRKVKEVFPYLEELNFPVVYKTYIGSAAAGVRIIKTRGKAKRFLNKIRRRGFIRKPGNKMDRQWGYAIFQEYISDAREWRVIRIGDSYFGHEKLKRGDFHSGSDRVGWCDPPKKLLNLCREVCDKGNFTSMALDVFEDSEGNYYVNELQTIFGSYNPSQMYIEDKPGRYLYDKKKDEWIFEEGYFNQNYSHNLRLEYAISQLIKER